MSNKDMLIAAQREYIKLIGDELYETVPLAAMHGWKSTRHEEGKRQRAVMEHLESCIAEEGGKTIELNEAQSKFLDDLLTRHCVHSQQYLLKNYTYKKTIERLTPGTQPIQLSEGQVAELQQEMEHCNTLIELLKGEKE